MAEIKIRTLTFIQNNPGGTFVTGDVMDFYYDPDLDTVTSGISTTEGFRVELNGEPLTSGPAIPQNNGQYYTVQNHFTIVCNGTVGILLLFSLLVSDNFFPYCIGFRYNNHPTCSLTPSACDIQFIGTPSVTAASGQMTTDGEITVLASSSAGTVKYKLGSDFSYEDGTAQTSGTFENLFPGTYRIYARDPHNCSASVQVQVTIDETYDPEYRLEYKDRLGFTTRIELRRRTFSGPVNEMVCGTGEPFELLMRGENDDDKFRVVFGVEAKLNLLSFTNFQWQVVYTNNPKEIQLVYEKDFGAGFQTLWTGFILPFQYSEPYVPPTYPVSIVATDNLSELDAVFLADDSGLRFYGRIKSIELIAFCLKKTGLTLNIRCACNLYASGMNTDDDDDPLDQAYVDFDAYYLAKSQPSLLFVIQKILEPYGARIVQWDNVWNIVRVEELRGEYDYREFDSDGVYESNSSFDPALTINCGGGIKWVRRDQGMQILHGYGKVSLTYHLLKKENILRNGDFRLKTMFNPLFNVFTTDIDTSGFNVVSPNYPLSISREENVERKSGTQTEDEDNGNVALVLSTNSIAADGSAYLLSDVYNVRMSSDNKLKFSIRVKVPALTTSLGQAIEVPYIKIRLQVKYGTFYLRGNGTWTTNEAFVVFYLKEFDKYTEFEVVAEQPGPESITGQDLFVKLYHAYVFHGDYTSAASLRVVETVGLGLGTKAELLTSLPDLIIYYELEQNIEEEADDGFAVLHPNDYDSETNPVIWKQKARNSRTIVLSEIATLRQSTFIDYVSMLYLTDGKSPTKERIIEKKGEPRNNLVLEKEIIHGSNQQVFTTVTKRGFSTGIVGIPASGPFQLSVSAVNVLSADLIYTGYLSDSDGIGYQNWARDGVDESKPLEDVHLASVVAQYNSSYRRLSGSIWPNIPVGFLNTFIEGSDNDRIYIPMGMRIRDKLAEYHLELLELTDITAAGAGGGAFTKGFSIGFDS